MHFWQGFPVMQTPRHQSLQTETQLDKPPVQRLLLFPHLSPFFIRSSGFPRQTSSPSSPTLSMHRHTHTQAVCVCDKSLPGRPVKRKAVCRSICLLNCLVRSNSICYGVPTVAMIVHSWHGMRFTKQPISQCESRPPNLFWPQTQATSRQNDT